MLDRRAQVAVAVETQPRCGGSVPADRIDPRVAEDTSLRAPFSMAGSFALGSAIPMVAFLLPLPMVVSSILSLVLAVAGLFTVGVYAARNTNRNPIMKGLEIVAFGCVVFALSYLAGQYIPPLFGHAPVAVGG